LTPNNSSEWKRYRISCFRVKRANPLGEGAEALSRHYGGLYGDFMKFFPELLSFSMKL
jgi:acyl carrier protein phosphodiesterase